MKRDIAIEEIRETRKKISNEFTDNPKALIRHYQDLEESYKDRMYIKSDKANSIRTPNLND